MSASSLVIKKKDLLFWNYLIALIAFEVGNICSKLSYFCLYFR